MERTAGPDPDRTRLPLQRPALPAAQSRRRADPRRDPGRPPAHRRTAMDRPELLQRSADAYDHRRAGRGRPHGVGRHSGRGAPGHGATGARPGDGGGARSPGSQHDVASMTRATWVRWPNWPAWPTVYRPGSEGPDATAHWRRPG